MTENFLAVSADAVRQREADKIAHEFHLPFAYPDNVSKYKFVLFFQNTGLELRVQAPNKTCKFILELATPQVLYRLRNLSWKKELIARAIGLKPNQQPTILDGTAGFGKDALILACLGYQVTLIEKSSVVFLLLQDAMQRALGSELDNCIRRMQLIHADTIPWLQQRRHHYDVIYLDPMFPTRQKSAAVKKDLVLLQDLLGKQTKCDSDLLDLALTCAKRRVVVKRPRLAKPLAMKTPNFSLSGKAVRYDIYLSTFKPEY